MIKVIKHGVVLKKTDLSFENDSQTCASIFHEQNKDKADITNIFKRVKLSVEKK